MVIIRKTFSGSLPEGIKLLKEQGLKLLEDSGIVGKIASNKKLFELRKYLTKDLGGLSNFGKHQTEYMAAGGSALGGASGSLIELKRAKKKAKELGLEEGTPEYKDFIKKSVGKGALKGIAIGGATGGAASKGVDYIRGKVIADKTKVGHGIDLGKNYLGIGKNMRGVRSEDDITNVVSKWKEVGGYLGELKKHL